MEEAGVAGQLPDAEGGRAPLAADGRQPGLTGLTAIAAGVPGAAGAAGAEQTGLPQAASPPSLPVLPGFREMALARMAAERAGLVRDLVARRQAAGLSQTEVAARMGTSQSAVARLESGTTDVRASTLERYAAAVGGQINWLLSRSASDPWTPQ
jgi:hypothetical protein